MKTFTHTTRWGAVLALLVLLGTGFQPAAAQTIIYDDARGENWWENTWNCATSGKPSFDLDQAATVASGAKALEVRWACTGGWGAFGFDHRSQYWTTYYITPEPGDVLAFKFNPGAAVTDDANLAFTLNLGSNGLNEKLSKYLPSTIQPNTWYTVEVPLLDLMKTPATFSRIYFWNMSSATSPHFFVDDMAIVTADAPPAQTPPVFTSVQVLDVRADSARVVWAVDRSSQFTFRYTKDGQVVTESFTSYATTGEVQLAGLTHLTTYPFEVEALAYGADPALPGASATYAGSFTTIDLDRLPPVISDVQVEVFPTHANLTWTTDEPAGARIEYGTGAYTAHAADATLARTHRLSVTDLAPGTTYQYRIAAADQRGNTAWYEASPPLTFTTQEDPATQQREIVYGDALGTDWWTGRWECATSQPAFDLDQTGTVDTGLKALEVRHDCAGGWGAFGFDKRSPYWEERYYMYPSPGDALTFRFNPGPDAADDAGLTLTLDIGSEGVSQPLTKYLPAPVQPNTWYTVSIPLLDLMQSPTRFFRFYFFNMSSANPHYYLDDVAMAWGSTQTPPVFSDVQLVHVGPDSVAVAWATDRQSQYTFRYTKDGQVVEQAFPEYATAGYFVVRGLVPSTTYPFEIEALAYGADPSQPGAVGVHTGTFTTADPDRTGPAFADVDVEVHATHAVVTWTTNEPADSRIEYGTTGYTQALADASHTLAHRLVVAGLTPGTTYQYRLGGADVYGNPGWHAPVPAATFTTLEAPTTTLTVDAGTVVRPFKDGIRGQALANWAVYWNRPYANDSPKLMELARLIRPGFLRYAGGLWSNNMMWSRENIQHYPSGMDDTDGDGTPDTYRMRTHFEPAVAGVDRCGSTPVSKPGAYKYVMQAEEMDRLAAFAQYVDAEVMIEVDVTTCDPEMWADMVRYVNVEKGYGFTYWELGNELDLERAGGVADAPVGAEYVARFKRYHDALKAVDPSVRISGPTTASHALDDDHFRPYPDFIDPLTADPDVRSRQMLGGFTFHYYPLWKNLSWGQNPTYRDMTNYTHAIPRRGRDYVPTMLQGMRQVLDSRGFHDVPIQITEFNAIAADDYTPLTYNHANALFMADMLGRLAYHGADDVAHWLLFDNPATTSYGILDHNGSALTHDWHGKVTIDDRYTPMPVYYTYLMYGQLFGDRLVRATSGMEEQLSIWASTDTGEPGALKLMVTNLSDQAIQATVELSGITIQNARTYELANPRWVAATDKDAVKDGTTINGLSIDASSAEAILASARAIMASGRPLEAGGSSFTFTFQPYTAVAILVNASEVVLSDIPALQPPVLLDPVPGATPVLQWQAAPRAHTYRVQVSADPSFATTLLDRASVTEAGLAVPGLTAGVTYYARVQSDLLGEQSTWSPVQAFTTAGAVDGSVEAGKTADAAPALAEAPPVEGEAEITPAYPNPFNPQTSFSLRLARAQHLRVEVYDALGRRVALLYDGHAGVMSPLTFHFDAAHLASGLYLYRVAGETFQHTGRMMLLK